MFKGFTQAVLVGILEVIVFLLLIFITNGMPFAAPLIFVVALILLVLYLIYLKRHIDEWLEAMPVKRRPIILNVAPKTEAKPRTIIVRQEQKPNVVNTIIKVPRNDIDYIRLLDYIRYNRYYGRPYDKIKMSLIDAGWDEITINRAFKDLGDVQPVVDLKRQAEYNDAIDRKISELKKNLRELAEKKQEVKPVYIERQQKIKRIYIEKKRAKPGKPTYFYIGSDVTGVYHTTKCRLGKSIKNKNKLKFVNAFAAKKAKLRPCNLCEPDKKK